MSRSDIPEVRRPVEGRLEVRIPWREGGIRALILAACAAGARHEWDGRSRSWLVPRRYFLALVEALAAEFGKVRVVTCHRDAKQCDIRCLEALGDECVCSCQGLHHGGMNSYTLDWRLIDSTTLLGTGWSESTWVVSAGMAGAGRRRAA